MLRLFALIEKEVIQVLRDPVSLMIMFIMPGVMLILFGIAISLDLNNINLVVWDLDRTPVSRELIRNFTESGYFTITEYSENDRRIAHLLDSGKIRVTLKIPPGFEENIKKAQPAPIGILIDGSDNNTTAIALSYINLIIQQFSTRVFLETFQRSGALAQDPALPVDLETRIWYNPELISENFFVPGLVAMVMMVTTTVLTAMSIVREKERGTIEMLMVAPLPRVALVLGKIAPYFVVAMANMFVLLFVSWEFFHVPFRGSITLLFWLSALFLLSALGLGILISTIASSQQVAWTICMLTTALPSFLLSGFIFPIESMPWGIRLVTYIVPVRYFIVILRGIIMKGVGAESLLPHILSLAAFSAAMLVLSSRRVSRRRL
ncbi:MAG: ABC transporter permease [Candidatus Abyssobacteria bacterium SURF_5]|uniref:Transport permease protein n=1 Tax=Abyssobacteria bacterium (strain SURF_5) TaxID=2093360 RepID=A0A3A4NX45_ABYX5|nr:MAG: ABC transporter permease [Candidatus Abyssubacteria bacterium SURF_5]